MFRHNLSEDGVYRVRVPWIRRMFYVKRVIVYRCVYPVGSGIKRKHTLTALSNHTITRSRNHPGVPQKSSFHPLQGVEAQSLTSLKLHWRCIQDAPLCLASFQTYSTTCTGGGSAKSYFPETTLNTTLCLASFKTHSTTCAGGGSVKSSSPRTWAEWHWSINEKFYQWIEDPGTLSFHSVFLLIINICEFFTEMTTVYSGPWITDI